MLATAEPETSMPEYEDLEDYQLVERYLESHAERAFSELFRRYNSRLVNKATRKTNDRATAEDIVAEAWRKATEHLHRFDPEKAQSGFSTWIWTITMRLVANHYRNRDRDPQVTESVLTQNFEPDDRSLQWADSSMTPEREWEKTRARELVEEAVALLKPHYREVFVLRELKGKAYAEIAADLNLNLGTVKSRVFRARREFAAHVRHLQRKPVTGRDEEPLVRLTETGVELIQEAERNGGPPPSTDGEPEEEDYGALPTTCALTEAQARELYHEAARRLPPSKEGRKGFYWELGAKYGVSDHTVLNVLRGRNAYAALDLPNLLEE